MSYLRAATFNGKSGDPSSWSFKSNGAAAVTAPLGRLEGVLVRPDGTKFATDIDNCIVVKIAPSGILNIVAGNGICGYSGDGGAAVSASISSDLGYGGFRVALDSQGNLYLADTYCRFRRNWTILRCE